MNLGRVRRDAVRHMLIDQALDADELLDQPLVLLLKLLVLRRQLLDARGLAVVTRRASVGHDQQNRTGERSFRAHSQIEEHEWVLIEA